MSEWQPIETAPKDLRVLVFVPDTYGNPTISGVFTAQWLDGYGWESGYVGCMDEAAGLTAPTHWMPLPIAPSSDDEAAA